MSRWYQNVLTGKRVEVKTLEEDDFYADNASNWARVEPRKLESKPEKPEKVKKDEAQTEDTAPPEDEPKGKNLLERLGI
jgi:hypothetical protein